MSRVCVINVAVGQWYPRGQDRLLQSLDAHGYDDARLFWRDSYPPGSPTHEKAPYGFKFYGFQEARNRGAEIAIWMDSSCRAVKPLGPMIQAVEEEGYLLFYAGFMLGQWCSDRVLAKMGITRDAAFGIDMLQATMMALDFRNPTACQFLERMIECTDDGWLSGSWFNRNGETSSDPRVFGHRHDQSAGTWVINQLGMKLTACPKWFAYYYQDQPVREESVVVAAGM